MNDTIIDILSIPEWLRRDIAWLRIDVSLLEKNSKSLELIRAVSTSVLAGEVSLNEDQLSTLAKKRFGSLGRYFEALVQIVISLSPDVRQCYSNVIVMDGNRTAGELDLLYECQSGWVHLELAVKYYIGVGDTTNPHHWHGPAARDTLGRKLNKLFDHQLKLPTTDAGQIALACLDVTNVQSEALIYGKLFHRVSDWENGQLETPEVISENHPNGWWGRLEDISRFTADSNVSWVILEKSNWLSSVPAYSADEYSWPDMQNRLEYKLVNGPVMFALFSNGEEINRGFVVPDDWKPIQ